MRTVSLVLAALLGIAAPAWSAPAVPAPESVLGFRPGEDRRLADWSEVLRYLEVLDAASGRVRVDEVGKTTQGRPFVVVTVTAEANQARLEEIRQVNLRLADPRGLDEDEAEHLLARGRTIVAMAYSIHSTEVGGTMSALALLHHLAASDSPEVRRILNETVLLVLPSHNPDGTQLVTEWYRRQLGTEFEGTPPPVLYHPYVGHDNNRDWYMFTQVETRLTVEHVHRRWHPQIMHDVHQMGEHGARLFVPPYTDPWDPNVDPALVAASNAIGSHVAARLTTEGKAGVVTGAIFDAWTPARAYPHTHGGVRVLSETASARLASPIDVPRHELASRRRGYDPRTPSGNFPLPWPGGWWRIGDIVEYQLSASLAVLDHAASHRDYWLRTALGVARRAVGQSDPFAFVVPATQRDPLAAARLLEVMNAGGVEVHRAREPFVAGGQTWSAGSHVISMQQPASAFARTLLQRQDYPDLRSEPGASPRRPYDVTAHTLPLLLGVRVESIAEPFAATLERVEVPLVAPGRVEGDGPRLALGHSSGDLAALGRLLAAGVEVEWALEPFSEDGGSFEAGALLVPSSAREQLEKLVFELGISARATRARPRSLRLQTPRVGLYRPWVPSMDEGWTRYVFEQEMSVAYRNLHDREVRGGGLRDRFDAIVLPDVDPGTLLGGNAPGSLPEEYTGGLGAKGVAALADFVERGGTLVALDSATGLVIRQMDLPVRDVLAEVDPGEFFCPGSILRVRTDPARPLVHGLPEALPIWFQASPAFEADAATVAAGYTDDDPLLSGWLLGGERLKGHGALVEIERGKGRVILFGFRPQYRAQSRVTYAALLNALYLSSARE
jgi:murein tripeptide amidase MpaA